MSFTPENFYYIVICLSCGCGWVRVRRQGPPSLTHTREYILFRNVEHCRNQFRTGIDSIRFRELDRHATQETHSRLIEFNRFRNSENWFQFRNSAESLPIPEFRESRNSGIANQNHTTLLTHIFDVVLISYFIWTRSNFGTEFRESRNSRIGRSSAELLLIPEIDGTRSVVECVSDVMCRSSSRN
jgi:hypothetical protein